MNKIRSFQSKPMKIRVETSRIIKTNVETTNKFLSPISVTVLSITLVVVYNYNDMFTANIN